MTLLLVHLQALVEAFRGISQRDRGGSDTIHLS